MTPRPVVDSPLLEGDEFISGSFPVTYGLGQILIGVGDGSTTTFTYEILGQIFHQFPITVTTDANLGGYIPITPVTTPDAGILQVNTILSSIQQGVTEEILGFGTVPVPYFVDPNNVIDPDQIVSVTFNTPPLPGVNIFLNIATNPVIAIYIDEVKQVTFPIDTTQTPVTVDNPDLGMVSSWLWSFDLSTLPTPKTLIRRQRVTARAGFGQYAWSDLSDEVIVVTQFFQQNLVNYLPPEYPYLDVDGDLQVFLKVFAITLDELKNFVDSFTEVFDIDNCDPQYLPVIAFLLGYEFNRSDTVDSQRRQLRTAVAWYKVKGTFESFRTMFYALGYRINLYELWTTEALASPPVVADPIAYGGDSSVIYHFFSSVLPGYPAGTPADSVPDTDANLIENGGTWFRSPHFAIELNAIEPPINFPPELLRYILGRIHQIRPAHTVLEYLRFIIQMTDDFGQIEDEFLLKAILGFVDKGWYSVYCDPDDPVYFRSGINFPNFPVFPTRNGTDATAIDMKRLPVIGVCNPGETLQIIPSPDMTDVYGIQLIRDGMGIIPPSGPVDITNLDQRTFPIRAMPNSLNDPIFRDGNYRYLNTLQLFVLGGPLIIETELSSHEVMTERDLLTIHSDLSSREVMTESEALTIQTMLDHVES